MLVKFLSYVASIIGARRYKPILLSFAVLTLVVTGVTMIATALAGNPHDSASIIQGKSETSKQNQPSSSDLRGLNTQEEKTQNSSVEPSQPGPSPETAKPTEPQTKPKQSASAPDFTLSSATVTLGMHASATLVATAANLPAGSTIAWSATSNVNVSNLTLSIEPAKDRDANSTIIRFTTDGLAPGNYPVTITAKDQSTGLNTSKTITLIVNS
ncbi:MAG TPA: hypothetical protein VF733_02110 [Candidatus Saccharimonadales bacterium]